MTKKLVFKLIKNLHYFQLSDIGITHVFFPYIYIFPVLMKLFEHQAVWRSVQTSSRVAASVNAMKNRCVIVILAYFTYFHISHTENVA